MKMFLSLLFTLIVFCTFCQNKELPKIVNDTLYTTSGYKIAVDQEIKLGTGTRDNGDFKYITVSSSSWLTMPSAKQASMRKTSNHHTVVVKKLKEKKGNVYYIVIGTGDIVNYECDVESAIAAGEIVVPDKYKPKPQNAVVQPVGVADELAKLKKLYDDSVITKEEFDAQKKKLLDDNN